MAKPISIDSNKDDILSYLKDPESKESDLTVKQTKLLEWYVDAYTLFRNYSSMTETITVLKKLGSLRDNPISNSTARRYINDALEIFGSVGRMKADVINHIVIETLLDARIMAKKQNNAMALKEIAKELRAAGVNDEAGALIADQIEQHQVIISLDQTAQRALQKIHAGGVIDLGDILNSMSEEAQVIGEENNNG
ncbi:hypothetical protein [Sphingobacterium siyangense]|uniref:hypothetical protein n=1 Tax=Sphingobacterium siyangense TaxID=459529 RepID=UPI003DA67A7E